MSKSLIKKFRELEEQRLAIFDLIKNRNNADLNQRPAEDKWSVLQIIDHLRQAEGMALQYMQKKRQTPDELTDIGSMGWLRVRTINAALKMPKLTFKAPSIFEESNETLDKDELFNEWMTIRQGLSEIINSISSEEAQKDLFKHPAVGKLNLEQALSFMDVHQKRHKKQIEQLL